MNAVPKKMNVTTKTSYIQMIEGAKKRKIKEKGKIGQTNFLTFLT